MAQIFVSHSRHDQALIDYLSRIAAGTNVRLIFEELERLVSGEVTGEKIKNDISQSNAVFVLVSRHVHQLPHTRDWVVWECGVASNKDIWVLEPLADLGAVTVVTPVLQNYVLFDPSDSWFAYFRQIIESYDDTHVLGTVLLSTGVGALFGKEKGAVVGAAAGLALANGVRPRPPGQPIFCGNKTCASSYSIHLAQGQRRFRCPVCNGALELQLPPSAIDLPAFI